MLTGWNWIQIQNLNFFFDISILTCQRISKEEKKNDELMLFQIENWQLTDKMEYIPDTHVFCKIRNKPV